VHFLNPVLFPPETGDEGATTADYQCCQSQRSIAAIPGFLAAQITSA
jgi:hypothetical protein